MTYDALRQFADSWGLLFLVLFLVCVLLFVMRRGSTSHYEAISRVPLEEDDGGPNAER
jgi:cytochrome c oxidase cbb3-type subunit 4